MLGLSAAMSAVVLVVVSVPIAFLALLVWVRSSDWIGLDLFLFIIILYFVIKLILSLAPFFKNYFIFIYYSLYLR